MKDGQEDTRIMFSLIIVTAAQEDTDDKLNISYGSFLDLMYTVPIWP